MWLTTKISGDSYDPTIRQILTGVVLDVRADRQRRPSLRNAGNAPDGYRTS